MRAGIVATCVAGNNMWARGSCCSAVDGLAWLFAVLAVSEDWLPTTSNAF